MPNSGYFRHTEFQLCHLNKVAKRKEKVNIAILKCVSDVGIILGYILRKPHTKWKTYYMAIIASVPKLIYR